jgi:hypothetical protein
MADSHTKGNGSTDRRNSQRNRSNPGKPAWGKKEKMSRIEPYRRKDETAKYGGRKRKLFATPPKDIVFRLACARAIELMEFDRAASTVPLPEAAQTPKKTEYSIMGWSSGEGENQTTAGIRYMKACCYGPIDPETKEMLDLSALTLFQLDGLRAAFILICLSEENRDDGALNRGYDITLSGMKQNWYNEGIDDIVTALDDADGNVGKAYAAWLEQNRRAEMERLTQRAQPKRDREILERLAAEEKSEKPTEVMADPAESTAEETKSEVVHEDETLFTIEQSAESPAPKASEAPVIPARTDLVSATPRGPLNFNPSLDD